MGYIENTLIWKQWLQDLHFLHFARNGSSTVDKDYSNSKLPPGLLDIANLFVVDLM